MSKDVTLAELQELKADEVAKLPVHQLQTLVEDVAILLKRAKSLDEKLSTALDLRFSEPAKAARSAAGKDTGRIRLVDNAFEIVADSPKVVVWQQDALSEIAAVIRDKWNENPTDYLTIKYGVSESKFNAWPPALQQAFAAARTVKVGKPSYEIIARDREAA
jgi:ribosomal silencing factor RsfS